MNAINIENQARPDSTRPMRRKLGVRSWAGVAATVLLSARSVLACVGDCNGVDGVTVDEIILGTNIALGSAAVSACPAFDPNSNNAVTVDEILAAINNALFGCPTGGTGPTGSVKVRLTNPTSSSATATISGAFAGACPPSGASSYGTTDNVVISAGATSCTCTGGPTCSASGGVCEVTVSGLVLGEWRHSIQVGGRAGTGTQVQHQRSILLESPTNPNSVNWKVYPTVYHVNQSTDASSGNCTTTLCSLRDAITEANKTSTQGPVLVTFGVAGGVVNLDSRLRVQRNAPTIDGTNADGHPSPLAWFETRKYPLTIAQTLGTDALRGELWVETNNVELRGLRIQRTLSPSTPDNREQSGIVFGTSAKGSVLQTSKVDGGASGTTGSSSKPCIRSVGPGTSDFDANSVRIENSELTKCKGVGVLSNDGHLVLRDSWVHENVDGGLVMSYPRGRIRAERNLIESNGFDSDHHVLVGSDEAVLSTPTLQTRFETNGNVIRNGASSGAGIVFADHALGTLSGDAICGMGGGNGIDVSAVGVNGAVTATGVATLLNARGVNTANNTRVVLNNNNAFTRNGTSGSQNNLVVLGATGTVQAVNSQWQSCGNGSSCVDASVIQANDISGSANIVTPQAHRATSGLSITSIDTKNTATVGSLIHITGTGFNAIEGAEGSATCTNLGTSTQNSCGSPVRGTCVEIETGTGTDAYIPAEVVSVTPTHVVVKSPIQCDKARRIRITRLGTTPVVSSATFCRN